MSGRTSAPLVTGSWRVVRSSGAIPPFGLSKRIGSSAGCTRLFGVPVACFRVASSRVRGFELRYRLLPVVDRLSPRPDGGWDGVGTVFGREFCRFHLTRVR